MPRGPRGECRPADVIGAAVMVARISVGDEQEQTTPEGPRRRAAAGGTGRAEKLSPSRRAEIAKQAAVRRWAGKHG
jgi:hypothetical protein